MGSCPSPAARRIFRPNESDRNRPLSETSEDPMPNTPSFAARSLRAALLFLLASAAGYAVAAVRVPPGRDPGAPGLDLDARLQAALTRSGFTGRIESTLEARLGRPIDR